MKTILAFGDSLTWGANPVDGTRHPYDSLWPQVLQAGLDGKARVIGEGLGGRTTVFDDHAAPCDRNGANVLPILLASHRPLDLVIMMLGTNDLKPALCGVAEGAHMGMKRLVQIIRCYPWAPHEKVPQILIVAPPPCGPAKGGRPAQGRSIEESLRISPFYKAMAEETGCAFFDAGTVATASLHDGVHLDVENTEALGRALRAEVKGILDI